MLVGGRGSDFPDGGNGEDSLVGAAGGDTVRGGPGADILDGSPGPSGDTDDTGRAGSDDQGAFRGIRVDLTAGRIVDGFGDVDIVVGIERVTATAFDDVLLRSDRDENSEVFAGRSGEDVIDGRGGFDEVRYDRDASFGGTGGIDADLRREFVTDGFGDEDTVRNVERIRATMEDDRVRGSDGDDWLRGLAGDDVFNGRGGTDTIDDITARFRGGAVNANLARGPVDDPSATWAGCAAWRACAPPMPTTR